MFQKIILSILEGLAITFVIYLVTGLNIKKDNLIYFALIIIFTLVTLDVLSPNFISSNKSLIGGGHEYDKANWNENFISTVPTAPNININNSNLNQFGLYASNVPYSAKPTIYSSYNNPLSGCPVDLKNLMNSLSPAVQNSDYLEQAKA